MHASQEVDVRDILDCDYKLIAQISGTAVLPDEKCISSMTEVDIPLVSRVFGPYCKLRTEFFFPSNNGPSARRAGHKSMDKNEDP